METRCLINALTDVAMNLVIKVDIGISSFIHARLPLGHVHVNVNIIQQIISIMMDIHVATCRIP
jgi:hypothetical protein